MNEEKKKTIHPSAPSSQAQTLGESESHEHTLKPSTGTGSRNTSRLGERSSSHELDEGSDHQRTSTIGRDNERTRVPAQHTTKVLGEMEQHLTIYCTSLKLGLKCLLRRHNIRCVSITETSSDKNETRYKVLGCVIRTKPKQYITVEIIERKR